MGIMALCLTLSSETDEEPILTKDKETTIINTTALADDVEGYVSTTPVKIYVRKDKVVRVEALENEETPKYFNLVEVKLLKKWDGMPVKKAETAKVDVISGATISSEAVIENVRRGISYYNHTKH
ncbi:MAG: FMN-binding protein [Bacteroidaceae bacterium]|nr:FMN-binding protein [Bacteroidaceae bacterium]